MRDRILDVQRMAQRDMHVLAIFQAHAARLVEEHPHQRPLALPEEAVFLKRRFRQQDRQEGDGQYHKLESRSVVKAVTEHGLKFEVNLSGYVDTGLFLDHRPTRKRLGEESPGKRVLNELSRVRAGVGCESI